MRFICKQCNEEVSSEEEDLWGHIQTDHEDLFGEIQDLETPDMIDECYTKTEL